MSISEQLPQVCSIKTTERFDSGRAAKGFFLERYGQLKVSFFVHLKLKGAFSFAIGAVAFAISASAQAGVTTYSSLTAFQDATTGAVIRDFNNYPGNDTSLGTSFTDHGVTFASTSSYPLLTQGPGAAPCYMCVYGPDLGTGNYLTGPASPDSVTATLSTPATAAGLNVAFDGGIYGTYYSWVVSVKAAFVSGATQTFNVAEQIDQSQFFGITDSTDPITSLTFTGPLIDPYYYPTPGPSVLIDNFETASLASAVPESSTWAMMILGFCALGFTAYRRKDRLAQIAA